MQARPRDNSQRLKNQSSALKVNPIRVAFLGKSASRGGSQRELSCIVKYLDKSRFEPMVLLPEGGDLLDDFKRHAATHVYSESEVPQEYSVRAPKMEGILYRFARGLRKKPHESTLDRATIRLAKQRDWAVKLISAFQPDLMYRQYHFSIPHFDSLEGLNIPSVQPVLLYGVAFAHQSDDDLRRFINRSVTFVCRGKKVRDYVHGCWGVPLDRIAMNCTGLDLEVRDEQMKSPERPRRADIGLDEDAVVVATSGSFHYRKGVDIWVEAAALLRARYAGKKLKFMWIGGSEGQRTLTLYGSAVMSLVREYGLADDVLFTGDQQHVYPYVDLCDIYVQPSRDDPFPHATLEAMSLAKPVVSFPEGVGGETYAGEALVRVEFSAEALADGIASLIDAPDLRNKLGRAGLQVIHNHFDIAASLRRLEEILVKVLSVHRTCQQSSAGTG
jgi:glycosyltransferase involved in cell wall biosynthesis